MPRETPTSASRRRRADGRTRRTGPRYYHWCLWTGIYMMDRNEARALNAACFLLCAAFVRSVVKALAVV